MDAAVQVIYCCERTDYSAAPNSSKPGFKCFNMFII